MSPRAQMSTQTTKAKRISRGNAAGAGRSGIAIHGRVDLKVVGLAAGATSANAATALAINAGRSVGGRSKAPAAKVDRAASMIVVRRVKNRCPCRRWAYGFCPIRPHSRV